MSYIKQHIIHKILQTYFQIQTQVNKWHKCSFRPELEKSTNMRVRKRAGWLELDFNVINQLAGDKDNSVRSVHTHKSVRSVHTHKSVRSVHTHKSVRSVHTRKSVRSVHTRKSVRSVHTRKSVRSVHTHKSSF